MKNLIINPNKEEAKGRSMISVPHLVTSLIEKVLRTTVNDFKPMVTTDHHTKIFINNVAYKRVPIQDYSGKELNSMQEAVDYYIDIGNKIYGKNWMVELIKNEIRLSKESSFGLRTQDPELVQYIQERLKQTDDNLIVIVSEPENDLEAKESKETKKGKKESKNV